MNLLDTFKIRDISFRNRIAVSPMCEYSSEDGFANDWHLVHLGSRAVGGAGTVLTEANAVVPEGRISPSDLGIWKDAHVENLGRIVRFLRQHGAVAGTQLAHAGFKASTAVPWRNHGTPLPIADGGWRPIYSSTAKGFTPESIQPEALTPEGIARIAHAFTEGSRRAREAGFELVEIHGAHGYLIYIRLRLTVPASKLSALAEQGELAFREPLAITRERIVIDGYARWELARLKGRLVLPCVEYELTEEESIRWLLHKHRRSNGMNDFCRILLARELEPCLKAKALSNQRFGGRMKGSSNLTEDAAVDVRKEIAAAAGVSVGNVTKVKQLVRIGHPELLEALRGSEVSIHRAWKWSKQSPDRQIEALRTYQAERGVNKSIRNLISRHKQKQTPTEPNLGSLARRLSELEPYESNSVRISVIRAPGKMIFLTEGLIQSLRPYQESMPICTTDSR